MKVQIHALLLGVKSRIPYRWIYRLLILFARHNSESPLVINLPIIRFIPLLYLGQKALLYNSRDCFQALSMFSLGYDSLIRSIILYLKLIYFVSLALNSIHHLLFSPRSKFQFLLYSNGLDILRLWYDDFNQLINRLFLDNLVFIKPNSIIKVLYFKLYDASVYFSFGSFLNLSFKIILSHRFNIDLGNLLYFNRRHVL